MSKTQQKFEEFRRKLRRLGFNSYGAYLQSSHWRNFRTRYLAAGLPACCTACGSSKYQLHHLTYEFLGDERLSDVIPLCRECHERVHEHAKLYHIPLERTDLILKRIFSWPDAEMKRRFEPFRKQEAIETGIPPISRVPFIPSRPASAPLAGNPSVASAQDRYRIMKNGQPLVYPNKRAKKLARSAACRMAYEGFIRIFNEQRPTDPMLMAECQRVLEELARRARIGVTT